MARPFYCGAGGNGGIGGFLACADGGAVAAGGLFWSPGGNGMDRWIIIGAVLAIFASLGVGGWYFQRGVQHPANMCANAEARCDDDRHL